MFLKTTSWFDVQEIRIFSSGLLCFVSFYTYVVATSIT